MNLLKIIFFCQQEQSLSDEAKRKLKPIQKKYLKYGDDVHSLLDKDPFVTEIALNGMLNVFTQYAKYPCHESVKLKATKTLFYHLNSMLH